MIAGFLFMFWGSVVPGPGGAKNPSLGKKTPNVFLVQMQ